jgi:hypothetical protein
VPCLALLHHLALAHDINDERAPDDVEIVVMKIIPILRRFCSDAINWSFRLDGDIEGALSACRRQQV